MMLKVYFLAASLAIASISGTGQDLKETRRFADELFASGKFSQALPAFQRVAYFLGQPADPAILLKVAECFLASGDLDHALEYFDHAYFSQTNDSLKTEILFRKSSCYLKNRSYNFALIELLTLANSPENWYYHRLNFYLGMTWFGLENFAKSLEGFEKTATSPDQLAQIRAIFADRRSFDRPNPKVASWLSIFIPGAGQVYSGQISDGINSFLLTEFFVALAFYLAVVTTPLDAILTALPWFERYYQGGFKRAEEFAVQRRAEKRSQTFDRILTVLSSPDT